MIFLGWHYSCWLLCIHASFCILLDILLDSDQMWRGNRILAPLIIIRKMVNAEHLSSVKKPFYGMPRYPTMQTNEGFHYG